MENLGYAYAQGRMHAQKKSEKTLILNSGWTSASLQAESGN